MFLFWSMFCIIKKQLIKTATSINKHIITNEIVWIRQLLILHVTFLSSSEALAVFNISFSHANTTLSMRRFAHEQFLIIKYSSDSHALLHSQSNVLVYHI